MAAAEPGAPASRSRSPGAGRTPSNTPALPLAPPDTPCFLSGFGLGGCGWHCRAARSRPHHPVR